MITEKKGTGIRTKDALTLTLYRGKRYAPLRDQTERFLAMTSDSLAMTPSHRHSPYQVDTSVAGKLLVEMIVLKRAREDSRKTDTVQR